MGWRFGKAIWPAMMLLGSALALSAPAAAQQKTAKQCNDEWNANKAQIQASGKTKRVFVAECRGAAVAAPGAPSAAPAGAPASAPPAASTSAEPGVAPAAPARRARAPRAAPAAGSASLGEGQYASEDEAKGRCFGDTVVWVNLNTKVYHYAGSRSYGTTRKGAYMCERSTAAAGIRAAKNEKHP